MNTNAIAALSLICLLATTGCSNLISATREEPIRDDHGKRTLGTYIEDEVVESKTLVNLSKASADVSHAHINVTSYNNVVLLTGQVPNETAKQQAAQIASKTRKVSKVHNELEIAGPTTAVIRANDAYLTSRVKIQLFANENTDGGRTKVVTENGTVYLMGLVTPREAEHAVNLIRTIPGVKRIVKVFQYIPHR